MAEVIGLIGAIVGITEAIIKAYSIAKEADRLPKAFEVVSRHMPLVQTTLVTIQENYKSNKDEAAIQKMLESCQQKADDLKYIFEQVCPVEGEGIRRIYRRVVSSFQPGRREKVESSFKEILDTLQTLQTYHIFNNIPVVDLGDAIEEVKNVEPSLPDSPRATIDSSGPGASFNTGPGEMRVNQQHGRGNYQAETMNFAAPAVKESLVKNPTLSHPFYDRMLRQKHIGFDLYTHRPKAMQQLNEVMARPTNRRGRTNVVVVYGIGGTGKTQLVLQYVEEHQVEYSVMLWLDGTSPESFVDTCIEACNRLGLKCSSSESEMRQELVPQKSSAVNELLAWLHDRKTPGKWLVVLDSMDDMAWGIKDVFPEGDSGTVIVTSRDFYMSRVLTCPQIALELMEVGEASALLRSAAFPDLNKSSDELDDLCAKVSTLVECLPLAIHLAAANVQTSSQINFIHVDDLTVEYVCTALKAYIKRFKDDKAALLLHVDDWQLLRMSYSYSLLATFQGTFDMLRIKKRPLHTASAMALLAMLAFVEDNRVVNVHERLQQAYSGISSRHRRYAAKNMKTWLSTILTGENSIAYVDPDGTPWDPRWYREALDLLHRYGLVRMEPGALPKLMPLHKVVRLCVQMEEHSRRRSHLWQYAILLELASESKTIETSESTRILDELGELYIELMLWTPAERCQRLHLTRQIEVFGKQHAATVSSLEKLIEILTLRNLREEVKEEVFAYVEGASDRGAVLKAFPPHLLQHLHRKLKNQNVMDSTRSSTDNVPPLGDDQDDDQNLFAAPINTLIGASTSNLSRRHHTYALGPPPQSSEALALSAQIAEQTTAQLLERKQALRNLTQWPPNLAIMFEMLTLGSYELLSTLMPYINQEMVRYRDPVAGRTVLHFIAAYGQLRDVDRCVRLGSDISARDIYGTTPLHVAGMQGRREVFKALIDARGDPNLQDHHGRTPIQYAKQRPLLLPYVRGLLESPSVEESDQDARTPSPEHMAPKSSTGNNPFSRDRKARVQSLTFSDNHRPLAKEPETPLAASRSRKQGIDEYTPSRRGDIGATPSSSHVAANRDTYNFDRPGVRSFGNTPRRARWGDRRYERRLGGVWPPPNSPSPRPRTATVTPEERIRSPDEGTGGHSTGHGHRARPDEGTASHFAQQKQQNRRTPSRQSDDTSDDTSDNTSDESSEECSHCGRGRQRQSSEDPPAPAPTAHGTRNASPSENRQKKHRGHTRIRPASLWNALTRPFSGSE